MAHSAARFVLGIIGDAAFLLSAGFLAYVLVIIVPFLRRRPAPAGDSRIFEWHFIVPCLDEEAVIEGTVRALVEDFPSAHLWCVDDGCTDFTGAILARLAGECRRIHVVTRRLPEAREGKGLALNAGWHALRRSLPAGQDAVDVIVGVVDADGRLDPGCLDAIAGPSFFGDTDVGAVQIQVRVVNEARGRGGRSRDRLLVRLQDVEFRGVIAAIQTLRRHLGSVGMGGNGQFSRLSVLETIAAKHGSPWQGALLEDFELGVHVLLSGSRTEYCHDTFVRQQGLSSLRKLIRQRSRWAQGSMQCIRYLRPVLRSANITNAGAIEIVCFLLLPWIQLVGGALYMVSTAVVIWVALALPHSPSQWLDPGGWGVLPLFVLFALGPIIVWGPVYRITTDRSVSRLEALALGVANWPYSYTHHVATWWAFIRVVRGRNDWKKTERLVTMASVDPPRAIRLEEPPLRSSGPVVTGPAIEAISVEGPVPSPEGAVAEPSPSDDEWDAAVVSTAPPARRSS